MQKLQHAEARPAAAAICRYRAREPAMPFDPRRAVKNSARAGTGGFQRQGRQRLDAPGKPARSSRLFPPSRARARGVLLKLRTCWEKLRLPRAVLRLFRVGKRRRSQVLSGSPVGAAPGQILKLNRIAINTKPLAGRRFFLTDFPAFLGADKIARV